MNLRRKKIAPIPYALSCASCKEVVLWPAVQQLICEFADAVRGKPREYLLSLECSGEIRHKKGTSDRVSKIVGQKTPVFFEIHNHPNPQDQAHAFLNPTDLSAAFLDPIRVFATAAMLLQVPGNEHVVSARYKPAELHKLERSDITGLINLHQRLERFHTTEKGPRFYNRLMRAHTIFEVADLYRKDYPILDFEIFEVDVLTRKLKHRSK